MIVMMSIYASELIANNIFLGKYSFVLYMELNIKYGIKSSHICIIININTKQKHSKFSIDNRPQQRGHGNLFHLRDPNLIDVLL